jgi:FkbM family methyltransferase
MKQLLVGLLLYFFHKISKKNIIRIWVKKVLGTSKIVINYEGIQLYAGTSSAIESNLIFDCYNEITVLRLIRDYAQKGYHFVDIGANIGIHSLTAARANSEIEIFSFEPESNNYRHFINNISLNPFKNIRPLKLGLGNFNGISELNINEGWNKGKHSLKLNFSTSTNKIKIPVTKLDTFFDLIEKKQVIIKIDVEGFEKEVIEGAKGFLQEIDNALLIIELLPEINSFESCKEIVSMLKSFDFTTVYKIDSKNELVHVDDFEDSADYIFIKGGEAKASLTI